MSRDEALIARLEKRAELEDPGSYDPCDEPPDVTWAEMDELKGLLLEAAAAIRAREDATLHQFPCGHFVRRLRHGDGSLNPPPTDEKCLACREIDALRSALDLAREDAAERPAHQHALRVAVAWRAGAEDAGHGQPMPSLEDRWRGRTSSEIAAYEQGYAFIHTSDVAREMTARMARVAKRAADAEVKLEDAAERLAPAVPPADIERFHCETQLDADSWIYRLKRPGEPPNCDDLVSADDVFPASPLSPPPVSGDPQTDVPSDAELAEEAAQKPIHDALFPPPPVSREADNLNWLTSEFDGAVWAREFCKVTGFVDEPWALTWFCNAIMAGYDYAKREAVPSAPPGELDALDPRALERVQRMAANARYSAGLLGPGLFHGHDYPVEAMHAAQDALALETILAALQQAQREPH